MANFYGKRIVDMEPPEEVVQALQFAGQEVPAMIPMPFDFATLKNHPMLLKLEAGASSYYSEIAAMQTLDNLLMNGHINAIQYLERVPDGYVPGRRKLILELKAAASMQMAAMPQMGGGQVLGEQLAPQEEIPTGGGYSELQRAINASGTTEGIV